MCILDKSIGTPAGTEKKWAKVLVHTSEVNSDEFVECWEKFWESARTFDKSIGTQIGIRKAIEEFGSKHWDYRKGRVPIFAAFSFISFAQTDRLPCKRFCFFSTFLLEELQKRNGIKNSRKGKKFWRWNVEMHLEVIETFLIKTLGVCLTNSCRAVDQIGSAPLQRVFITSASTRDVALVAVKRELLPKTSDADAGTDARGLLWRRFKASKALGGLLVSCRELAAGGRNMK